MKSGPSLQQDRQIRVFISSTFRDMQAERDYLVKFIFPQLRKLCESRGVAWGEVDLRWGVTDEQVAEGKVLPICLEEIKRCRPYFIGLLGERYGWIPDAISPDLIERESWLAEHLHGRTSVTELEILHGVLRNPQMAGHAYFYLRDPKYVASLSDTDKKNFAAENVEDAEKLRQLKGKIRQSKFPVRENYPGPKELGEFVLADLTKVINENWPEGSQPDPLDREAMDHEAYAQSRERVYIGRQEYFERLDVHATANDNQPLVVLGESGSGKSALLANWVTRYRQAHPDALVLQHYIGATPYSADWAAMLRRLMGEFKQRLGIQQDIPDQPDALRNAFPNWLYMAAAKGRVVLVLDALNQLEDRDGAPDLVWLPPVMPENVRLIVSTLPGRSLDEIQKRNWPTFKVYSLNERERLKLLWRFLRQSGKRLSKERRRRIANAPQSANPLYLRVLLDELRLVRTHEELEERIGDYLKAESPYALYEKVIARWEQDYEGDSDLVGDTLSLLWAARRGLAETELLQALGKDGVPLPRAKWSPLFLAMSDALISRGGLLTFAHDFLRTAVENAYLPTETNQQRAHLRLANWFERQTGSSRRTDELPWQFAEAQEWERLQALLIDSEFFFEVWNKNQFDVKRYWARMESSSDVRMVTSLRSFLVPGAKLDGGFLAGFGRLLRDTGHLVEALAVHTFLVNTWRASGELTKLQAALGDQAGLMQAQGDLDGALSTHQEQERICRQLGLLDGVATALNNQALISQSRGKTGEALKSFDEAERICRQLGNSEMLPAILINKACLLVGTTDLGGALALLNDAERVSRQTGNLDGVHVALGKQANILLIRGDLDASMALLKEKEKTCRELGNVDSLKSSLYKQAEIQIARGNLDDAMALLRETERISRQLVSWDGIQASLRLQSSILDARGDFEGAMALLMEAERICRKSGLLDGLCRALGEQGVLWNGRGDLDKGMALLKESEDICRQLGDLDVLQTLFNNQALNLYARGDLRGAMELLKQQEHICRQNGILNGLQSSLGKQAGILQAEADLGGALVLLKEQEQICRQLGSGKWLAIALIDQAIALCRTGSVRDGLLLAEESFQLVTRHRYSVLAKQIEPIVNSIRQAATSDNTGEGRATVSTSSVPTSAPAIHEQTVPEILVAAATALKRGLWEAAETYLEKLLQQGEPVETVAPDLVTALLNAHETVAPSTVTRIESLLAQLESAGHATLAASLREKLNVKLPPKKPRWKFW